MPISVVLALSLTLLAVVATLLAAAASRHNYRRTRLAGAGSVGLLLLDVATPIAVLLVAPVLVWPMAFAIPASLARIAFTARSLPRVLTS